MSDDDKGVYGSISKYAVSKVADKEAYSDLRDVAASCALNFPFDANDATLAFNSECREGENEFMEVNYGGDPKAKHQTGKRAGEWKFRTFLPNSYSSSKTELVKGLQAGIDPTGLGKSALNKARTAQTKVERTVEERFEDYLGKLARHIIGIDDDGLRQHYRETALRRLST